MPVRSFNEIVLESQHRLALPIATYPGLALSGGRVSDIVTNPEAQLAAQVALQARHSTPFLLSAMDLVGALGKVPGDVVLCGNLDPTAVFAQSLPAKVTARAAQLLAATAGRRNFVVSSGCDVPASAPLASLDAFYEAVNSADSGSRG